MKKNLFLIENHKRDDNLGDQLISMLMGETFARFGMIRIAGQPKSYHHWQSFPAGTLSSKVTRITRRMLGWNLYRLHPPGGWGRLRSQPSDESPRAPLGPCSRIKEGISHSIAFKDIALGISLQDSPGNIVLRHFDWVGGRDNATLGNLAKTGLANSSYFPDFSFFLPFASNRDQKRYIAVSFRQKGPETPDGVDISAIRSIATAIQSRFPHLSLCFFSQVEEDRDFSRQLHESFGTGQLRDEPLRLDNYHDFYAQAAFVISNRLHCLLLGAANGAIPVALTTSGHAKLVELFRTVGWDQLLVDSKDPESLNAWTNRSKTGHDQDLFLIQKTFEQQQSIARKAIERKFC